VITLTSQALPNATALPKAVVFTPLPSGATATVNVNAFTTAAPFSISVSPADAATLVLGMVVQSPFAGTPSIIAINPATGVITLTSQALPNATSLPKAVVFVAAPPGATATVTVNAFTTAAPFSISVSPADAAKLVLGMVLQNPFAGTPTIIAIDPAAGVITLTSQALPNATSLPKFVVFANPGTPPSADLSITKVGPSAVSFNTNATYMITVSNAGPSNSQNVVVTDVIPSNTSFVSATPSQGSCSGTATVTCNLGTVNAGSSATITLILTFNSGNSVTNTASVTADTPDPNLANNSSTTGSIPVTPLPSSLILTLAGLGVLALYRTRRWLARPS
jgi:uncharacterized repeat protein (TIGR01451 family)